MRVIFAKTKWEARELPLPEFLRRARSQGFTATEINIPELSESPKEIREDVPLTVESWQRRLG
jgi:hypothetical protein